MRREDPWRVRSARRVTTIQSVAVASVASTEVVNLMATDCQQLMKMVGSSDRARAAAAPAPRRQLRRSERSKAARVATRAITPRRDSRLPSRDARHHPASSSIAIPLSRLVLVLVSRLVLTPSR